MGQKCSSLQKSHDSCPLHQTFTSLLPASPEPELQPGNERRLLTHSRPTHWSPGRHPYSYPPVSALLGSSQQLPFSGSLPLARDSSLFHSEIPHAFTQTLLLNWSPLNPSALGHHGHLAKKLENICGQAATTQAT